MSRITGDDFDELFRVEYGPVLRAVAVIVGDLEVAREVVQDAFVQLFRHWAEVSCYDRPGAWVRRVGIRIAVKRASRDRRLDVVDRVSTRAVFQPDPHVDLKEAIGALSLSQRTAVVLYYLDDRSLGEVAEIMGTAEGTVKTHLHRGRHRLAELLGEESGDA